MKKNAAGPSGFFHPKILASFILCGAGSLLAVLSFAATSPSSSSGKRQISSSNSATGALPTAAALQALHQLRDATHAEIMTRVSRPTGNHSFVAASDGSLLSQDNATAQPLERVISFLATHGALFGINEAERAGLRAGAPPVTGSELRLLRSETDAIGMTHVRLDQFYNGLQVSGAQLIVHMNGKGITAVNGNYVSNISLQIGPTLTEINAGEAAVSALREAGASGSIEARKTELGIYPLGLVEGTPVRSLLAYAVDVFGPATHERLWIDANTGAVLIRIPLDETALHRIIYSPQYDPNNPTLFIQRQEGDPPSVIPFVNNLYDFAGQTYNVYSSGFGRDSYDGLGHIMRSVYLINQQCPNAYWNGESTNYCPAFDADDVVSHEWSHAYTQFTHGLIYAYQSGALNESYSDIFGETVDLLNGVDGIGGSNNAQPYPNGQRWLVGEDLGQQVQELLLRDMHDPDRLNSPGKVSSPNYACGSGDGGGVHTNSGVPNHAFELIVDGTQFYPGNVYNGQTITGIGMTKAAAIYYRAESLHQTPTTDFAAHDAAIQLSCNELRGAPLKNLSTTNPVGTTSIDVITTGDCMQVAKAMLAVEMSAPPPCPFGPLLDPNPPSICSGPSDIFTENWESGDDGWTRISTGTYPDWENPATRPIRDFALNAALPQGRSGTAIYAKNPPIGAPGGGNCIVGQEDYSGFFAITSPDILLPPGATAPQLIFDHYVATEAGVDGGQVEVSVNGGAFALLPQAQYSFNPPNIQYNAAPPVGNNTGPNPGEWGWIGTNTGSQAGSWGTTVVSLSSVAAPGSTIKIRFTWSQDGCNGVDGWYVDNIRVFNCPLLEAPILSLGPDYQNPDPDGSFTLNWTRPSGATGPDLVQISSTSCSPLLFDNAESGTGQWTIANSGPIAPIWQSSLPNAKPGYNSTAFWANPISEQGTQNTQTTLTFNNPIVIPSSGTTSLSFLEWYFNEDDDKGYVEVSTNNGSTWTPIYTNGRPMGDVPDTGATAFATESLTGQQLDLTVYSGQTIRLRFRFALGVSNFFLFLQYGWYIDNITITNDSWVDVANVSGTSLLQNKATGNYCYRVRTTYHLGTDDVPSPFSNIVSVTVAPGVSPTPPPSVSISGNISTCSNPSQGPVQGVTLTLAGSPGGSTVSDASGNYQFSSLTTGGSYTITPSKAPLTPGSVGGSPINTTDVIATQRHFLQVTSLSGCRLTAGDVNGDSAVNTVDVTAIQRFYLGLTTGTANVGRYNFSPGSRAYPGIGSNQTNQNYDALVLGDVTGPFAHRAGDPSQDAGGNETGIEEVASTVAAVALPEVGPSLTKSGFAAAVTASAVDAKNKLVGFQGDFTFDERVVTFASEPVQKAGLTAGNWNVAGNVLDGPGPIRTLRISAYSTDFVPLSGTGTLFELNVTRASTNAQPTQLFWAAPPDNFIFIDAGLNTQRPRAAR